MKKHLVSLLLIVCLFLPAITQAHPGRTDSSGCHTCRTNCSKWGLSTGEYHCHQAKSVPQPIEPIKSHYSENGGYTTPAPEYKQPKVMFVEPKVIDSVKAEPIEKEIVSVQPAKASQSLFVRFLAWLFN
jgi:hypothetical protein